jgi:hypothetical protein
MFTKAPAVSEGSTYGTVRIHGQLAALRCIYGEVGLGRGLRGCWHVHTSILMIGLSVNDEWSHDSDRPAARLECGVEEQTMLQLEE